MGGVLMAEAGKQERKRERERGREIEGGERDDGDDMMII